MARRVRRRKNPRHLNDFMTDSKPFLSSNTTEKQLQKADSSTFRVPSINLQNPFPLPGWTPFPQKPFETTQLRNQYSRPFQQISSSSSNGWSYDRKWSQAPACMPAFGKPPTWGNNFFSPPVRNLQNFAFTPGNNFVPNYWFSNAGNFQISDQVNNVKFPSAPSYKINTGSKGRYFKSSTNAASRKNATSTSRNCDNAPANIKYNGVMKSVSTSDTSSVSNVPSKVTMGNKDDEVTYLFSVDSTPSGLIVEEINLADDAHRTVSTANSSSVSQSNNDTIQTSSILPSTTSPASNRCKPNRKRKTSCTNENTTKRANTDQFAPRCSVCEIRYDSLVGDNKYICIGDCGHMFCQHCIRKSENKVCKTCKARNLKFCKLYL